MDGDRGDLEARVDGCPNRTAEGVPAHVVKPVEEGMPPMLGKVLRRAEVEPRVELVNDKAVLRQGVGADSERVPNSPREESEPGDPSHNGVEKGRDLYQPKQLLRVEIRRLHRSVGHC